MKPNSIETRFDTVNRFINSLEEEKRIKQCKDQSTNDIGMKLMKLRNEKLKYRDNIAVDIIARLYVKSLPLDHEYVDGHHDVLKDDMKNFINHKGGFKYITDAQSRTNSKLLKSIIEAAEQISNDHYTKPSNNISEINIKDLDYDMDEDDEKIEKITDSLEFDEISIIIKDNVKNTILDEIEKSQREEDASKKIQEELNVDDGITTESAITKEISRRTFNHDKIYQPSLFEAIMIGKSKYVTESVLEQDRDAVFTESIREYTQHMVCKTLRLSEYFPKSIKELTSTYL